MRRTAARHMLASVAILAVFAAACGGDDDPQSQASPTGAQTPATSSPTPSPSATSTPKPKPKPAPAATHIVYDDFSDNDIWLYTVATNTRSKLVSNTQTVSVASPQFKTKSVVSYIASQEDVSRIISFPMSNPASKTTDLTLTGAFGFIHSFNWSPDGKTLAYLVDAGAAGMKLYVEKGAAEGKIVRSWNVEFGRDGFADDDTRLEWSPDGKRLLMVFTAFGPGNNQDTMWVMDPAGKDLIPPRSGTFGRWSPDSSTFYYREFEAATKRWFALNASNGSTKALKIKTGTWNLAVSPDGKQLATETGYTNRTIFVYDTATSTERKFAATGFSPLWFSAKAIAYTRARACVDIECDEGPWAIDQQARKLTIATAKSANIPITTTDRIDILYA
jgi:Tol biopolymer transport system component